MTWSIPVGARACLLGPKGSGKTTSIRLLEAALAPTTGWVAAHHRGHADARRRTGAHYVLAVVLLLLAALAALVAMRWITFERYFE